MMSAELTRGHDIMRITHVLLLSLCSVVSVSAHAWGADGHHTVGALAAKQIKGSHAAAEVKAILGNLSLRNAAVWADCAKGIDPGNGFKYASPGKYPECKIYETPAGEAAMADFVKRNFDTCHPRPGEEICHKQYHYADISILQSHYDPAFVGARNDDVVSAINAAVHVLKGDPSPAPFDIKDKREALLLLAHYVGDVHQPLHVGAIYLDQNGHQVDPDAQGYDQTTDTRGGNNLLVGGRNFHTSWDLIPASMTSSNINASWSKKVAAVAVTSGDIYIWSATWATDSVLKAQQAFHGAKYTVKTGAHWNTTLPAGYAASMNKIKKTQLTAAGAHLAQLLQAIWP